MNISRQALKYLLLGIIKVHAKKEFEAIFKTKCLVRDSEISNECFQIIEIKSKNINAGICFSLIDDKDAKIYIDYDLSTDKINRFVEEEIPNSNEYVVTEIIEILKKCFLEINVNLKTGLKKNKIKK